MNNKERIARKIAQDIKDGMFMNFGHGIPYSVSAFIDPAKQVIVENECGVIGMGIGTPAAAGEYDMRDISNAIVSEIPAGGVFLADITASFSMIRGGHVDVTVLGAMQVDEHANIANWMVPGNPATGIGGAMDLCAGCKEVWAAMESTTKDGAPKLVENCGYPLTAAGRVTRVYTEFGVLAVHPETGFELLEIFPDYTEEDIIKLVEGKLTIADCLKTIDLGVPIDR